MTFGYADRKFCAAVVPIASETPATLVGHKAHSLPHAIKVLSIASLAGVSDQ